MQLTRLGQCLFLLGAMGSGSPVGGGLGSDITQPAPPTPITPVVSQSVSGGQGAAPLAVLFNAFDTMHEDGTVDTVHDLIYEWNFGDTGSGTWPSGAMAASGGAGQSRNTECCSPIAFHVFEDPGVYTVTLTVTDAFQNFNTWDTTITVDDPDSVTWPTTSTTCISTSGSFGACPSGADTVTSSDFDAAWSSGNCNTSVHRCLFRRGEIFNLSQSVTASAVGPNLIGAYDTGADPKIVSVAKHLSLINPSPPAVDWRFVNLHFTSDCDITPTAGQIYDPVTNPSGGYTAEGYPLQGNGALDPACDDGSAWQVINFGSGKRDYHFLLHQNTVDQIPTISNATLSQPHSLQPEFYYVSETTYGPSHSRSTGANVLNWNSENTAVVGNVFDGPARYAPWQAPSYGSGRWPHIRVPLLQNSIFAHNKMMNWPGSRGVFGAGQGSITFRGNNFCDTNPTYPGNCTCPVGSVAAESCDPAIGDISRRVAIVDNHFQDEHLFLEQANTAANDGLENFIVERNYWDSDEGGSGGQIRGEGIRKTTIRNNILRWLGTGGQNFTVIRKGTGRSVNPFVAASNNPTWNLDDVRVYGNSYYKITSGSETMISNHDGTNTLVANNAMLLTSGTPSMSAIFVSPGPPVVGPCKAGTCGPSPNGPEDNHTVAWHTDYNPPGADNVGVSGVSNSPFVSQQPADPDDFCPDAGSAVLNVGVDIFRRDFYGNARDATPDSGAIERGDPGSEKCPTP